MTSALADVQLHYVESLDECQQFMTWLGERRPVLAVDTETTGLQPHRDHVRLVQFGDINTGWTFRWDRWGGVVQEIFARYEEEYVFHHAKFDLAFLARSCEVILPPSRVHDTMIMAKLLDGSASGALKPLGNRLIDPHFSVGQQMLDKAFAENKWDWDTVPYTCPAYTIYAAMDTVGTARLFDILYPQILARCPEAYDLEREFATVVQKIEARGSKVDLPFTKESCSMLTNYITELETFCETKYHVKPGSNQAVISVLAKEGVDFIVDHPDRTPAGAIKLDKDVLDSIDHPLAKAVLQRRQAQKVVGTYLENFIEMADDEAIIRPSMNTQGTVTGRMSMQLFQTLPRRSESNLFGNIVRDCIIPREGNVLFMCDWDQIEMRILSFLTQDAGLLEAFTDAYANNGDFFLNMTREIFDDQTITRNDDRRQMTKNGSYSWVYGAGDAKFSATAGVSFETGSAFMAQLKSRYPGMETFSRQVQNVANQRYRAEGRPYVVSPLTRQPYYLKRDDKIYALVNYLVQGSAASILKMKTCELDRAGMGDYLTLLVHDEVIGDIPTEMVPEMATLVKGIMNDNVLLAPTPVTASLSLAERWGSKMKEEEYLQGDE
jgi:DNA polymerase I